MKGRLFTFTAAASALLFLATALPICQNLSVHFSRGVVAWELAFREGRLWLDNQPQMKLRADRQAAQDAAVRSIFNREPWGSPGYQKALEELNRINAPPQPEPGQPKAAVLPVQYSPASLGWVLFYTAIAPGLWLLVYGAHWLRSLSRRPSARRSALLVLLDCLATVSALLLISMVVLWVRSYGGIDEIFLLRDSIVRAGGAGGRDRMSQQHLYIYSCRGAILVRRFDGVIDFVAGSRLDQNFPPGLHIRRDRIIPAPPGLPWRLGWWRRRTALQGKVSRFETVVSGNYREMAAPEWPLIALTLLLPAIWARVRLRPRVIPGTCARCGYDLRATPDLCPECGAVPEGAKA